MEIKEIIVISGKQYSGKDTIAKILLKKLKNYKRIGIGDSIKLEYSRKTGLTLEKIESDKHLYRADLIELGNFGRKTDENYWLKNLMNYNRIIVPDVRVEHELNFFKTQGAFLIRVESDIKNREMRGIITNADDKTETALDNYKDWNIVVENNSTYEDLIKKTDKIISCYRDFIGLSFID